MAFSTRSGVFAFIKEDTEGVLKEPLAANFTAVREGANLVGAVNTTESDEQRNSIGASKQFTTNQAPTGNIPKYIKTSGVEGQAPDYAILIESALGGLSVAGSEFSTVGGSTAGDSTTRGTIAVTPGDELNFAVGQAMLIKDGTNGYAVRHVYNGIASGSLPLNFNLNTAPGAGVGLGQAVFWYPVDSDQPTYSSWRYQSSTTASALKQAISGTRTTNMAFDFPANELGAVTFDLGGLEFFTNPIEITATNKYIDFTDDGGTIVAILDEKVYATPMTLALEVASKMTAASAASGGNTITCEWGNKTGLFTIATDGVTLSLLWNSGANTANTAAPALGFDSASDDTAALTYSSDNEQTYEPPATPAFDDAEPAVIRDNMLLLGDFDEYECFGGQALTITVGTPKTDVPNWCSVSGIDESITLSREVTVSGTLKFKKHDVERIYKLLNNESVQLQFVTGIKSGGNWVPGTVTSIFLPNVSVTTNTIDDADGYLVETLEGTAYVGSDINDIFINQL